MPEGKERISLTNTQSPLAGVGVGAVVSPAWNKRQSWADWRSGSLNDSGTGRVQVSLLVRYALHGGLALHNVVVECGDRQVLRQALEGCMIESSMTTQGARCCYGLSQGLTFP